MLSDRELRAAIKSEDINFFPPLEDHQIQPSSIDLRLAGHALVPMFAGPNDGTGIVSAEMPPAMRKVPFMARDGNQVYELKQGEFCLVSTVEKICLSDRFAARVEGRSTMARLGLTIHSAGFIDPGFRGHITLELYNQGPWIIQLVENMRIAQICAFALSSPAMRPYGHADLGSKYQEQFGTAEARKEKKK